MNFNTIEDLIGLFIAGAGTAFCLYVLVLADRRVNRMYPCEKEYARSRKDRIDANMQTALTNFMAMLYFLIVMLVWFAFRKDTAPDMVDVLVLLLKVVVVATICRSSVCALRNVQALARIRMTDRDIEACGGCRHCPKRKELE